MSDAERWVNEHLERLREETSDWPDWMKRPQKPVKPIKTSANGLKKVDVQKKPS